jgi:putative colanic acid biosynthesis UDP-glucose lipid carrier transferase
MSPIKKDRSIIFQLWNDIGIVTISFFIAATVHKIKFNAQFDLIDFSLFLFLVAGWYFSSQGNGLYKNGLINKKLSDALLKVVNSIVVQLGLLIFLLFALKHPIYTRMFVLIYISLLCILIPIEKILFRKFLLFLNKKGVYRTRTLVIGAGKLGMDFYNTTNRNKQSGYEVIGFLDDKPKTFLNGKYLGTVQDVEKFIDQDIPDIDEVVIALPNSAQSRIKEIADIASKRTIKLSVLPSYSDIFEGQEYKFEQFYGLPMIKMRNEPLNDIQWRIIKRFFDVVFSSLVLVLICSWLFPLIALIIKLDSKGPVFFVQERWSRKNIRIKCLKFRSMYVNSRDEDKNGKYQQAKKDDARITKVGKFLRKTSLDEFPQFINVLLGDMSVVGPRPHPTPLNIESKQLIDNYLVRHLVKSGITGWAQVNGFRGETTDPALMRGRVKHDIWYIENWTLLLDLKIIFLTFWKTFSGDKNAF